MHQGEIKQANLEKNKFNSFKPVLRKDVTLIIFLYSQWFALSYSALSTPRFLFDEMKVASVIQLAEGMENKIVYSYVITLLLCIFAGEVAYYKEKKEGL